MRIATANVQHGVPDPKGRPTLASAVVPLGALGADVYALQELDRGRCRTRGQHQGEEMAAALGGSLVWARAKHWLWAAQGNALVVRGAVEDAEVVRLPAAGERRVAALAGIRVGDGGWSIGCAHLSLQRSGARRQLVAALAALAERPPPRVLAGDLNLQPDEVRPIAAAAGYDLLDGPATIDARSIPRRRLDHVLVQGATLEAGGVAKLPVSDHLAVWADVAPAGPS